MDVSTDLPVFALHMVAFPAEPLTLRVFETRYLTMLDEVLPDAPFVVAAIRRGREVGGPAETYRVGVEVRVEQHREASDGAMRIDLRATDRVALIEPLSDDPFPRWRVAPYPDEGGAGTDDVEAASEALHRYLRAIGEDERPVIPRDPVTASWVLAAATPGLVPERQALLEAPGAGERLTLVRDRFTVEARLVGALGTGVAAADPAVNPN